MDVLKVSAEIPAVVERAQIRAAGAVIFHHAFVTAVCHPEIAGSVESNAVGFFELAVAGAATAGAGAAAASKRGNPAAAVVVLGCTRAEIVYPDIAAGIKGNIGGSIERVGAGGAELP